MKKGFTLTEVLITLAVIGVVVMMVIPAVIKNFREQEYKSGLKKALSVLNKTISMNVVSENKSPNDVQSGDLAGMVNYFTKNMNVISANAADGYFYTTDGMRFQFLTSQAADVAFQADKDGAYQDVVTGTDARVGNCTKANPCYVVVDVNGERNPNVYTSVTSTDASVVPVTEKDRTQDVFYIRITDREAIPVSGKSSSIGFDSKNRR